jgi:hypothetical protein
MVSRRRRYIALTYVVIMFIMQQMSESVDKSHLIRPDREAKRAERRAKRELAIKAERTAIVSKTLKISRNCGVIAMSGVQTKDFLTGISDNVGNDRVLVLPAQGNIQGQPPAGENVQGQYTEFEHAREMSELLSLFWRKHNKEGLIIFEGTKFSGDVGSGTEWVADRVTDILMRQNKRKKEPSLGEQIDPMIILLGHGVPEDLQTATTYRDHEHTGVVDHLSMTFALCADGELTKLTTVLDPILLYEDPPVAPGEQLTLDT